MSGVNKAILVGNVGQDPETRDMPDGKKMVMFSLATSESWKDKGSGERQERTEWHKIVIWDQQLGDIAMRYVRKGSKIYLSGQVQTRKWSDAEGQDKYTTEIVLNRFKGELQMLDSRHAGEGGERHSEPAFGKLAGKVASAPPRQVPSFADLDDEIPF